MTSPALVSCHFALPLTIHWRSLCWFSNSIFVYQQSCEILEPTGTQLPELVPVSVAWSGLEYFYPLDRMLVHCRPLPHNLLDFPNNLPVLIYTPGWRQVLWELVSCPRTQHSIPSQGPNPDHSLTHLHWGWVHEASAPPTDNTALTKNAERQTVTQGNVCITSCNLLCALSDKLEETQLCVILM